MAPFGRAPRLLLLLLLMLLMTLLLMLLLMLFGLLSLLVLSPTIPLALTLTLTIATFRYLCRVARPLLSHLLLQDAPLLHLRIGLALPLTTVPVHRTQSAHE